MATLGQMKASGEVLTLYCEPSEGPPCHHRTTPSIDQLIQYFGVDFDVVANRAAFLARFSCQNCGRRFASLRLGVAAGTVGTTGGYGHDHQPPLTVEEATRRYHEMEAERRRLGIKSNAELNAESRAKLLAEKRAARSGADFIGPPNPWAHRKRGRWL
jgi:hypothetical protein